MQHKEGSTSVEEVSHVEEIRSGVSQVREKLKEVQLKANELSRDMLELDTMVDELDEAAESIVGQKNFGTLYVDYSLTVTWDEDVATDYNLNLSGYDLAHGWWKHEPPAQITPETQMPVQIKAVSGGDMTGVEGHFEYTSSDSTDNPSKFSVKFDLPYSGKNSGDMEVTDPLNYYQASGGKLPTSASKGHLNVKISITQVGPT